MFWCHSICNLVVFWRFYFTFLCSWEGSKVYNHLNWHLYQKRANREVHQGPRALHSFCDIWSGRLRDNCILFFNSSKIFKLITYSIFQFQFWCRQWLRRRTWGPRSIGWVKSWIGATTFAPAKRILFIQIGFWLWNFAQVNVKKLFHYIWSCWVSLNLCFIEGSQVYKGKLVVCIIATSIWNCGKYSWKFD